MKAIKTTKARKATPNHFGRRTPAEQSALDSQRTIHAPRNLKQMLLSSNLDSNMFGNNEAFANSLIQTIKHWLMDCAHERRMAGEMDEQDTIERVIDLL